MTTELDLHHLVVLMSFVYFRKSDGSSRKYDHSIRKPKFGFVDDDIINFHTCYILDALAHLSVSQERSQVVALGLQFNQATNQARLIVAENTNVADGLISHLKDIWGNLQELSNIYDLQRRMRSEVLQLVSPDMGVDVGQSLKKKIFGDIYQYSWKKQANRIAKWLGPLGNFMKVFKNYPLGQGSEHIVSLCHFHMAMVSVNGKLCDNASSPLMYEEWEDVYRQTSTANEIAKIILKARGESSCEALASRLHDNQTSNPFQLRRALEKMTSLVRHIETLFHFAHSPTLRPALQPETFISPVPRQTRTVKLPSSVEEWKIFLEVASRDHGGCGHVGSAARILKVFGTRDRECPVHAECALIHYLQGKQNNDWDNVPAFTYIGVSKLSCSSCRVWIELFNEENNGLKFYTRGSHGKWYWPWGMPGEGDPLDQERLGKMAARVLDSYKTHLQTPVDTGKAERVLSDSTVASSSGAKSIAEEETIGHPAGGVIDTLMKIPDRKREQGMRK